MSQCVLINSFGIEVVIFSNNCIYVMAVDAIT